MFHYYKNNKFLILISFFWIIIWASLNTFPSSIDHIKNTFSQPVSINDFFINLLGIIRFYLPMIFSNLLIIFLISKSKKNSYKDNLFTLLYIFFFISQFLGLYFLGVEKINLERTFLLIFALNAIGIIYLANINLNAEQIKSILFINLFFLVLILFLYLPIIYFDYFSSPFLLLYNTRTWSETFIDDPVIRVTGLSRVIALISILFVVKLNENLSKKITTLLIFLLIILGLNIWGLQSKLTIMSIIIILAINLTFFSKGKFFRNLLFYILIIILSISLFKVVQTLKLNHLKNTNSLMYKEFFYDYNNKLNRIEEIYTRIEDKKLDQQELVYVTSGRNLIWKKIIKKYDFNKFFGYGPQADRYELLKSDKKILNDSGYMSNASSSLFYSFASGGYLGIIIIVLINLYIVKVFYDYLKLRKHLFKEIFYLDSLCLIITYILIRSIFENSHAVFSLDFLIILSCTVAFTKILKKQSLIIKT